MEINKTAIAKNIKDIRKKLGLTQDEFANLISTTRKYVSAMENESSIPSIDMIYRIYETLQISPNAILYENLDYYNNDNKVDDVENVGLEKLLEYMSETELCYMVDLMNEFDKMKYD